ncbi:two component transcriptional regulator, LuxR family [Maridesulfovibrio ferrireducens]|uniref:Two component transcriptional regulator, LuxR family n=1 Tax=Maridesulfovibrio ferrireducens TaxID=246191 RepID=A0A1G9JK85_9BACT|nr:response regulator transcription factor [Maridesulfovibrio ferrireducens]SDL37908.1 two component transcriptional regulator, LuxR family [Maridesulfovibrio ferrireducens]
MTKNLSNGARVFLVDDHPAMLDGLTLLLACENYVIIGVATNQQEALQGIDSCEADIALIDLSLCGESGLRIIPLMVERNIPVLVFSMHEDAATQKRAMDCGARGYVSKRETSTVLLDAVRQILGGNEYFSPRVAANQFSREPISNDSMAFNSFSEQETLILTLLSQGESNSEIAEALGISVRTVETYCTRIAAKLKLDGMKALRKYAINEY